MKRALKHRIEVNTALFLIVILLAIFGALYLFNYSSAGSSWYAEVQEKAKETSGQGSSN